jgi:hypothetical protein
MEDVPQPGSLEAEAGVFCSTFDQTGTRLITGGADKTIKVSVFDVVITIPLFFRHRYMQSSRSDCGTTTVHGTSASIPTSFCVSSAARHGYLASLSPPLSLRLLFKILMTQHLACF